MKLEVGKYYISRDGDIVQIKKNQFFNTRYPFRGDTFNGVPGGTTYTEDGKWNIERQGDNPYDLIREATAEEIDHHRLLREVETVNASKEKVMPVTFTVDEVEDILSLYRNYLNVTWADWSEPEVSTSDWLAKQLPK